jgi:dihydropyrimidine dehydrogenase (NAD+) subunit PreT
MNGTNNYLQETVPPFTPRTAMEEAARCLLCLDAPCSRDCPAGTDPGAFIRSIRFQNFKGAAEIIRKNNILGGICGRVCPVEVLCEEACSRTGIDKPIEIGRLQRFATDYEKATGFKVLEPVTAAKEKVAMIGSGPGSLAAAAELAKKGYQVTVFDDKKNPGGVLSYGIVPSRLPQYIVDEEIAYIKELGVEFIQNTRVGKDITLDELREKGFKAFMIGAGMQAGKTLDIPGIDLQGVEMAVDYLADARTKQGKTDAGCNVVVIGGGDVAMDCASTARLLGGQSTVLYRRTREEMPATKEEVTHCEHIGVRFYWTFTPEEIIGENGNVTGIKGKGSRDGSYIFLEADKIVLAIGQEPEDLTDMVPGLRFSEHNNFIISDNHDGKTNLPDIFAAGDIVGGARKTVVHAVEAGKTAAESIDEYLTKERR